MAEIRVDERSDPSPVDATGAATGAAAEPSLGELFRQLAQDSTTLIRQEVALAKTEMRDNVRTVARDATMIAVGGGLVLIGLLVLSAFLVILLGDALANYWLSALVVGAVYLIIGGAIAWTNLNNLRNSELKPEHSIDSMKKNKDWLQEEIRDARKELT